MIVNTLRCKCGNVDQPTIQDMTGTTLLVEACGRCQELLTKCKNDVVLDSQRTDRYVPPSLEELEQYAGPWD